MNRQGPRAHFLSGTPARHDAPEGAAPPAVTKKGCATFWVVREEGEAPQRVAVPVARLGHPRMMELLGEARDEFGFAHEGAVVVPCGVERFMRAVEAASGANDDSQHRHGRHHHHFRLPHIARCFRPSHVVA